MSYEMFSVLTSEGSSKTMSHFFIGGPEESLVDKVECRTRLAPYMGTDRGNNVPSNFITYHTRCYIPTTLLPNLQPTVSSSTLRMETYLVPRPQSAFQSDTGKQKNTGRCRQKL